MKFPIVCDIASKEVISIDIDSTVSKAIEKMCEHEHRRVVVIDNDEYYLVSIVDVLEIQSKGGNLSTSLRDLNLPKIPKIPKDSNVLDTIGFLGNSVEFICVVNFDNSLYGLVTHTDITSSIDPETLMENYKLQDFLKLGRRMKWVSKDEPTFKILAELASKLFDNVIIIEDKKPIGILTTKDVMKLIKQKEDLDLPISNYMTTPVESIQKNFSIKEALEFIKEKHYKRIVVVDENGNISGIITQKDLISLTYSRWAVLMKEYQNELNKINKDLENKYKEYETMACLDPLTGLYNRYKFSGLFLSSYAVMLQRHNSMSLIMLDIDFFKRINDTYGHNTGDVVLVELSNLLQKILREIDIICRWGGEEFVVLLPTVSLENTCKLAEKIRLSIEKLEIENIGQISASFGVAKVREGEEMQNVIDRADKALYLAKNSGRNCVKTENDI